jgi:hypothetical protein
VCIGDALLVQRLAPQVAGYDVKIVDPDLCPNQSDAVAIEHEGQRAPASPLPLGRLVLVEPALLDQLLYKHTDRGFCETGAAGEIDARQPRLGLD